MGRTMSLGDAEVKHEDVKAQADSEAMVRDDSETTGPLRDVVRVSSRFCVRLDDLQAQCLPHPTVSGHA